MTPERAAELVGRWVRFYTRGLPEPVARRRIDEIAADLHDHAVHEQARGTSDRHIALSILSRMARGLISDALWRRTRLLKGDRVKSFVAVFVPALAVAAIGVAAIVLGESDDAPGLVLFGTLLIVGALAVSVAPTLRRTSRVIGLVLGAIALTVLGAGIAGWLENAV